MLASSSRTADADPLRRPWALAGERLRHTTHAVGLVLPEHIEADVDALPHHSESFAGSWASRRQGVRRPARVVVYRLEPSPQAKKDFPP